MSSNNRPNRNHNQHPASRGGRGKRQRQPQTPEEKLSRALSWALRHQGPKIGLTMTPDGYVPVSQILQSQHPRFRGNDWTLADVKRVVQVSDKQRYQLERKPAAEYPTVKEDGEDTTLLCIRASQGHSLDFVDPELLLVPIPDDELAAIPIIVHGTYLPAWETAICQQGLNRMTRNHIHCAPGFPKEEDGGVISGMRGNCTVHIFVDAKKCAQHPGISFYRSANGVLLTAGIDGTLPVECFSHVTDSKGQILLDQRTTQPPEGIHQ